jgi:transposase
MNAMVMVAELVEVVLGVDTHRDSHTVVAASSLGAALGEVTVPADAGGYAAALAFAAEHGSLRCWAIEGVNSYGAGLARFLQSHQELVVEVDRPHRPARRNGAKSDPIDALRAARDVLARGELGSPRTGQERAILARRMAARRSAVDAAVVAQQQLRALVITGPDPLRARLAGLTTCQLIARASQLRARAGDDHDTRDAITTLQCLAQRVRSLQAEAHRHELEIHRIVASWRPDLLAVAGVGPIVAATILCAWSHPGRCRNDGAFAMLAGTAPIPASSGHTDRHRLNRSGDRQLNRAIHTIMLSRLSHDPTTQAYRDRRQTEGKTKREAHRCLKRYITRELYRLLEHPLDRT